MNGSGRKYDLVLWGATGFTGRLVAEYLAEREGVAGPLRWAIAGRNAGKLRELADSLSMSATGASKGALACLSANSADLPSLRTLAARTRVLISAVGPYALHGSGLVQACAEAGTDYCDLSGEVQWIQRMVAKWDAPARASGARILHCCGFDSVPFDLGVWYLQRELQSRFGVYAPAVRGVVRRMRGNFSGGTVASMLNMFDEAARDPALRRLIANANALLPAASAPHREEFLRAGVEYDPVLATWTGPFVMAAINTKIVRRSHALLGAPWTPDFDYTESMATGPGIGGRSRAIALKTGLAAFMLGAALAPTRALMKPLLPKPGEGPDPAARAAGCYEIDFVGLDAERRPLGIATVSADLDPGYGSTSRMLAECALCLAQDSLSTPGGSWTPAAALGAALLRRLETRADVVFKLRSPA